MIRNALILIMAAVALGGCTTVRETSPQRSATEQLLVSTAADHAVERISLPVSGSKVFVDASGGEGADAKYAVAALREQLVKGGAKIAADRGSSDIVVEFRAGALSIDEESFLIGIPSYDIPVPLAGPLKTPEFALFKREEKRGVAKFVALAYTADTGDFVGSSDAQYGFSYKRDWKFLFAISWSRDDLLPDGYRPSKFQVQPPLLP